MATNPSEIPIRSNGQDIRASWFNTIREVLVAQMGAAKAQTSVTLNNNTNEAIAGLSFDSAEVIGGTIEYWASRVSDTDSKVVESGELYVTWNSATGNWTIYEGDKIGDAGLTWSITQGDPVGNVAYQSSTFDSSGYSGRLDYKTEGFNL